MKERDIYRLYKPPLRGVSHTVEIKLTKTGSIPFSALAEHQEKALLRSLEGHYMKIPDPMGGVGGQLPYDVYYIVAEHAFVAVMFYIPRKPKVLYFILIQDWIAERERSKRKSLTHERAREISAHECVL